MGDNGEEGEDDYLTMIVTESDTIRGPETYSQRRARKLREHESTMQVPSPKVLEVERRETALSTNMLSDKAAKQTKAMRMMKMMGYIEGMGLGTGEQKARVEPLGLEMPEGRKGIGHDMAKKRKLKEAYDESVKRQKEESEAYVNNLRAERECAHLRENIRQAQLVCQNLDEANVEKMDQKAKSNVLWRGLVRERTQDREDQLRRKRLLYEHSPFDHEEYDKNEVKLEKEDTELDEFEALPLELQLNKILLYMRDTYYYCFWCGCPYNSAEDLAENCPGLSEDDH